MNGGQVRQVLAITPVQCSAAVQPQYLSGAAWKMIRTKVRVQTASRVSGNSVELEDVDSVMPPTAIFGADATADGGQPF